MKLKQYNADNSKSVSVGVPCIRATRKSGTISFSRAAMDLMGITKESAVIVSNDEDSPRDWYIHLSKGNEAFKLRSKQEGVGAMFNCSLVAGKLLNTIKADKSGTLRISKEPVVMNGVSYYLLITATATR